MFETLTVVAICYYVFGCVVCWLVIINALCKTTIRNLTSHFKIGFFSAVLWILRIFVVVFLFPLIWPILVLALAERGMKYEI